MEPKISLLCSEEHGWGTLILDAELQINALMFKLIPHTYITRAVVSLCNIALLHGDILYEGVHAFLISEQHGGEWSSLHPGRFVPGE
jgi:hypothetical protein